MNRGADAEVWRALADPTRRAILDHLRDGPKTTGDLAARFEQSRYGVMKHLSVLEAARLLTVRRKGRHRFNHLNAIPLRRIYERWMGPYQEFASSSLLRLAEHVETPQESPPMPIKSFHIEQELVYEASRDKVWQALTAEIGSWWSHHLVEDSTITLEACMGGLFAEHWGEGEGAVYGEVRELRTGEKLRLCGNLGMSGAGTNDYVFVLSDDGDRTRLTLSHHSVGYADADIESNYTAGWKHLLDDDLRTWLKSSAT